MICIRSSSAGRGYSPRGGGRGGAARGGHQNRGGRNQHPRPGRQYVNENAYPYVPMMDPSMMYPMVPRPMPMIPPPSMFYPASAFGPGMVPYANPGMVAQPQVLEAVQRQIEYYFSVENLCKDLFLRSKMDQDGWIPLLVVANFNRSAYAPVLSLNT